MNKMQFKLILVVSKMIISKILKIIQCINYYLINQNMNHRQKYMKKNLKYKMNNKMKIINKIKIYNYNLQL